MRLNPELEMPDVHLAYSLDGEYGANIMLNKQFLKMASDRFGGDYYVIPASIYELILISGKIDCSEEERTALNKMIGGANKVAKMEKFIRQTMHTFIIPKHTSWNVSTKRSNTI